MSKEKILVPFLETSIMHVFESSRNTTFRMLTLLAFFVTVLYLTGVFLLIVGALQNKLAMSVGGSFGLIVASWSIRLWYNTWKDKKFIEFLTDISKNLNKIQDETERKAMTQYLVQALLKWREMKIDKPEIPVKD